MSRILPFMKKRNTITRDSEALNRRKKEEQISDRVRQLQQEGRNPKESLEQTAKNILQNIDNVTDPQDFNKMVPDDFNVDDMDMLFNVLPDDFNLDRKMGIAPTVPDETEVPSADTVAEIMKKTSATSHERGRKDPLRMYMLTIGSVPLLDKEGEVTIAKQIESGEKDIIRLLLDFFITFKEIVTIPDKVNNG